MYFTALMYQIDKTDFMEGVVNPFLFQTFEAELAQNGLRVIKKGVTVVEPDFPQMMFAVVKGR